MLRKTFFALAAVLATAASSQAAIIVQASAPTALPTGGLVQYTLTAVGTAGEVINTFSAPTINAAVGSLGIHNVWQTFTGASTPTTQEQTAGLFDPSWAPYDTYFMYNSAQTLSAGSAFTETNDGSTQGTLGLAQIAAQPTKSGFGTYSAAADASKVVLAPIPGTSVPFMHVVMRAQDSALLTVNIQGNGGTASAQINNFSFGSTAVVPEPATLGLLGLALAGCFGFIRRR